MVYFVDMLRHYSSVFFFHNSRCCLERTLTKNVTLTLGAASICITIYIIIIHIYIYRASGRRREGGGSPQGGYIHAMPGHATVSQNHTETEEMVIPSRKLTLFWPISLGSCWILGMHKNLGINRHGLCRCGAKPNGFTKTQTKESWLDMSTSGDSIQGPHPVVWGSHTSHMTVCERDLQSWILRNVDLMDRNLALLSQSSTWCLFTKQCPHGKKEHHFHR